jgi:hypothetical protein
MPNQVLAVAFICALFFGCDNGHGGSSSFPRFVDFWSAFEIDGDWVEYAPTLFELSQSADLAGIGKVEKVEAVDRIQGDAAEDVYFEVTLRLRFRALLAGNSDVARIRLLVPRARSVADAAALQLLLPTGEALFFLRQRARGDFRPVNGAGIWAKTPRAGVDTPLQPYVPADGIYAAEVADRLSVDALFEYLHDER